MWMPCEDCKCCLGFEIILLLLFSAGELAAPLIEPQEHAVQPELALKQECHDRLTRGRPYDSTTAPRMRATRPSGTAFQTGRTWASLLSMCILMRIVDTCSKSSRR